MGYGIFIIHIRKTFQDDSKNAASVVQRIEKCLKSRASEFPDVIKSFSNTNQLVDSNNCINLQALKELLCICTKYDGFMRVFKSDMVGFPFIV